ncbi:MAG: transglutaminase-like domain-containing protein [Myxococcota bacterium]
MLIPLPELTDRNAPIEELALALARDVHPRLHPAEARETLDQLAVTLAGLDTARPLTQARALTTHLFGRGGFAGNEADYYDPRNSCLDWVLAARRGIPITLAVVLMAVARRVGIRTEGIGFPGHFLARVGGEVLIDPFAGGVVGEAGFERLVRRFLGDRSALSESHVQPVDSQAIIVRMVLNLRHALIRKGDHGGALLACDRLVDLTHDIAYRRDRGLLALKLGSPSAAAADLQAYLKARPTAKDIPQVQAALRRAEAATNPTHFS